MKIFTLSELEELNLIQLGRGKVISKNDLKNNPGTYPVYSSAKKRDGVFGTWSNFDFNEEMITWSVDGGGDLFYRSKHKFSVTNVGGFIRITDKNKILTKYLFYALKNLHNTVDFDWVKKAHPSVLRKEYNYIPVPSLQEQEKIVEKLDKVYISKEKLSKKCSQASRLYADLKNSVLKQTFEKLLIGNKISLLGEITTVASGGTPKKSNVEYWNGGIDWLSSGELENLYLDSSVKQISKLGLENSSAKIFPEGSLLVGMYDTAAFKMSIINFPMAFNQAICGITPDDKIDILFIYYQLQFLKNKILKQRVGVRQQNLNISKMRNIEVIIPDLKIQKVISKNIYEQFSYIDELSNINSNKNPKLQELMKSALRKEFSYE